MGQYAKQKSPELALQEEGSTNLISQIFSINIFRCGTHSELTP